ncbi:MAG: ATP-binding cassette domain-containing protein [Christensenellaceae bacterium]|nr:ATP-binding cassette domain-containing protein [Christensenellaceae bacterium]
MALTLKNVYKIYNNGTTVEALSDVNIEFPDKGIVFILGKSGSGKSTLLNVIAGMDLATSGEVYFDGMLVGDKNSSDGYRNNTTGFVFQEFNLNKSLNVFQNVLFSERIKNNKLDFEKAERVLTAVGLLGKGKKKINQLSGGEQQRTAIARVLIKEPRIIFADEPTGKLDEVNGTAIFKILKKISEDTLVIVVSHDRPSAERYADRIIELSDGKVVSDTTRNDRYHEDTAVIENVVQIVAGKELSDEDIDIINSNIDKPVRISYEKKFCAIEKADENISSIENTNTIFVNTHRMRGKNILFFTLSNLINNKFKTIIAVLISSILFAVLGLCIIITTYNEHQASARTYIKNDDNELVIFKKDTSSRRMSLKGVAISDDIANYFKARYGDGYLDIFALNGFNMPDYLQGFTTEYSIDFSINGVFEIKEAELETLGYSLMDFKNVKNVFYELKYDDEEMIEGIRKALNLPRPSEIELPQGIAEDPVLGRIEGIEDAKTLYDLMILLEEVDSTEIPFDANEIPELSEIPGFEDIETWEELYNILYNSRNALNTKIPDEFWQTPAGTALILFAPQLRDATIRDLVFLDPPQQIKDIPVGNLTTIAGFSNLPGIENVETLGELLDLIRTMDRILDMSVEDIAKRAEFSQLDGIDEVETIDDLIRLLEERDDFEIPETSPIVGAIPQLKDVPGIDEVKTLDELLDLLWSLERLEELSIDELKDLPAVKEIPGIEDVETREDLIVLLMDNEQISTTEIEEIEKLREIREALGLNDPKSFSKALTYCQNSNDTISFLSRFPLTGRPVVVEGTEKAFNEVVITDFLAYIIMAQFANSARQYLDIKIPTEEKELKEFLNSGFEATLVEYFNAVIADSNLSSMRVVGILETGYKEKYFNFLTKLDSIEAYSDLETMMFTYTVANFLLRLYSGSGFAKSCYAHSLVTSEIHFIDDTSSIYKYYRDGQKILYSKDYAQSENLSDNEIIVTENQFVRLFGQFFNEEEEARIIESDRESDFNGMDFSRYRVVGVIRGQGEEFEKSFGVVLPQSDFDRLVEEVSFRIAIRITPNMQDALSIFEYMGENSLYYASFYSIVTASATPTINTMKTILIPLAIFIGIASLIAFSMFLTMAVTKRQKEIGIMKSLGMRTLDVFAVYVAEGAVTVISVLLISLSLTYLFFKEVDIILRAGLSRFIYFELLENIVLLYVTPMPFVLIGVSILLIGVAAILIPIIRIVRMTPSDAIRKE